LKIQIPPLRNALNHCSAKRDLRSSINSCKDRSLNLAFGLFIAIHGTTRRRIRRAVRSAPVPLALPPTISGGDIWRWPDL